jgi:hypothetical protein
MAERRKSLRQKSFLRGCVYFNKGRGSMDCLVRDFSNQGARIIMSDAVNIPAVIELEIPQKNQTLRSRVIWRHGVEIGLAFADADLVPSAPSASNDLTERVAQIENEMALMQRMLKRLVNQVGGDSDAA